MKYENELHEKEYLEKLRKEYLFLCVVFFSFVPLFSFIIYRFFKCRFPFQRKPHRRKKKTQTYTYQISNETNKWNSIGKYLLVNGTVNFFCTKNEKKIEFFFSIHSS